MPDIAPDARRRRLTAFINAAAIANPDPAIYVIEDAHWIDESSESMLADFLKVVPQSRALVLVTYRPEYHRALARLSGAQTIALRPLTELQTSALTTALLGADPSLGGLPTQIAARAGGNPFFIEEIVRDLAGRTVLRGRPGAYVLHRDLDDVQVPATLQATIGSRIDRLSYTAKRTLNAASVIGMRFNADLLAGIVDDADLSPLLEAELVDQVGFASPAVYAFRHPLIRTVAYNSQLKADRAQSHRRLAAAIGAGGSPDENAALIAEHLESAGDLHAAFSWHMRAATWSTFRNIAAAQSSWRRARGVADQLPNDDPERASMRIAPRTLLCANAYRVSSSRAEIGFNELRDLCTDAGDMRSLAIGMAGLVLATHMNGHRQDASRLATELITLLQSIGDPTLTVALSVPPMSVKLDVGEISASVQLAQRVIDLADGKPIVDRLITVSPLASAIGIRGTGHWCLGRPGWKEDFSRVISMADAIAPAYRSGVIWWVHITTIPNGVLLPDATALRETTEIFTAAQQSGDDLALDLARGARGITLVHRAGAEREAGRELLMEIRDAARDKLYSSPATLPLTEAHIAREIAELGDIDGAIALARTVVDSLLGSGEALWTGLATAVLVESLLHRGSDADLRDAQVAIKRLAAVPTEPGFVLHEIWLLRMRALLAKSESKIRAYQDYRDRYRKMATDLGFEGHMAWAEAMP
jgi:adenylate cyclase